MRTNREIERNWKQVPAIYVDYFSVNIMPPSGLVRVAFSEWVSQDEPSQVRTAVMMSLADAKELAQVLGKLIAETEEETGGQSPQ